MKVGVIHQFAGGTREQYEAARAAVHPRDGSLPTGQLSHTAGPSKDGWTVVVVHDSLASWETFRDSVLMPTLQAGVPGGFAGPPQETLFDVEVLEEVPASIDLTEPARAPRGTGLSAPLR